MLDLLEKDFNWAIINIFKIPKGTKSKELKENKTTMSQQIQNINKELEIIKKNKRSSRMKKCSNEMKISLRAFNRRTVKPEERITKAEDGLIKNIWFGKQGRLSETCETPSSIWTLWDSPKSRRQEKGQREYLKK